jgi:EmrB/QacA subfamily drug resistance transporter
MAVTGGARYRLLYLVLALLSASFALMHALVGPVLPLLQRELGTTQAGVAWTLTAYLLSAAVATPILGRLGDMVGRRRVLLAVLAVLVAGTCVCALATTLPVLVAGRAVQGLGGGMIPIVFGIVRDEFPPERVAGAIGVIAALLAVGGGFGVVLAGPISSALGYHWLFWLPAMVLTVTGVIASLVVPAGSHPVPGSINWVAAVLLSSWLVLVLLAISQGPVWGWTSPRTLGAAAGGLALLVAWVAVEVHAVEPLIDMRMMRLPAVWTTNACSLLYGAGLYATGVVLPGLLQAPREVGYGFGVTASQTGLIMLPQTLAMFALGLVSGRACQRFGAKYVVIAGSTLSVVSFTTLAAAHDHLWSVMLGMVAQGMGFGLAYSAMSLIIVETVPAHQTGAASGMNANVRTIGGAAGTATVGAIIGSAMLPDGHPAEGAFTASFAVLAVAIGLATLFALLIPRNTATRDRALRVRRAEEPVQAPT